LCRFGGLRCLSEVLSLRWQDVNWEADPITVQSPRTEHHPGLAPDGPECVVGGDYRQAALSPSGRRNCNLRTQLERLLARAGLKKWPRLFHAMRASWETELAKEYPLHVVTAWLGNTPRIAMRHYLQVVEADFEKAQKSGAESGVQAVQKAVQPPSAAIRKQPQETTQAPDLSGSCADSCELALIPAGIISGEDRTRTACRNDMEPSDLQDSGKPGAAAGAAIDAPIPTVDAELGEVIAAWTALPVSIRQAILEQVREATAGKGSQGSVIR